MKNENITKSLSSFIAPLVDAKKIIENSEKEIKMWRERYLKNFSIPDDECGSRYLSNIVRFTPAGIEDIDTYMENCLRSYRETQEKKT